MLGAGAMAAGWPSGCGGLSTSNESERRVLDVPADYEPNIVKKLVHKLAARMARF